MIVKPLRLNYEIIVLTAVYTMLTLLDATLTLWGLDLGIVQDTNPAMRLLISKSPLLFLVLKSGLPCVVGFLCWRIRNKRPGLAAIILGIAIATYSLATLAHGYWLTKALVLFL